MVLARGDDLTPLPHFFGWEQQRHQQGQVVKWGDVGDMGSFSLIQRDGSFTRLRTGFVAASISAGWAAVVLGGRLVLVSLQHGNIYKVGEGGASGAVAAGDNLVVLKACGVVHMIELYRCDDCVLEQLGRFTVVRNMRIADFNANREALAVTLQANEGSGSVHSGWSFVHVKCVSNLSSSEMVPGPSDHHAPASTPIGAENLATIEGNARSNHTFVRIWSFKDGEPTCVYRLWLSPYMRSVLTIVVQVPGVSMDWLRGAKECTQAENLSVIEDVQFDIAEQATTILPEEGARIAEECWSSGVEHLLQQQHVQPCDLRGAVLLTFSREARELEDGVLASSPALRAAARGVELKPDWANGAKVLVEGIGPEHVETPTVERLGPQHVLVNRDEQDELLEALSNLPYRIRKLKPNAGIRSIPEQMSLLSMSSRWQCQDNDSEPGTDDSVAETATEMLPFEIQEIRVRCTFIHFSQSFDSRSVRTD